MRLYNSISILSYMYPVCKYESYRAAIILLNGIIYHAILPENKYMMMFDCFTNFLIASYTAYYSPKLVLKGLFCIMLFLINDYLYYTSHIGDKISQLLHILSVHIPFLLMLMVHHKDLNIIQNIDSQII